MNTLQCPSCADGIDSSADRRPSCGFDTHALRLLRARLDETEQRLAALETAIGVGDRNVTGAHHVAHKSEGRALVL